MRSKSLFCYGIIWASIHTSRPWEKKPLKISDKKGHAYASTSPKCKNRNTKQIKKELNFWKPIQGLVLLQRCDAHQGAYYYVAFLYGMVLGILIWKILYSIHLIIRLVSLSNTEYFFRFWVYLKKTGSQHTD